MFGLNILSVNSALPCVSREIRRKASDQCSPLALAIATRLVSGPPV